MGNEIRKGDIVHTPRFLNVRIAEVYGNEQEAIDNGYTETTHYIDNLDYGVLGRSLGNNRMVFAAYKKIRRQTMAKRMVLYKTYNPDRLFGGYFWNLEENAENGWNGIVSEPYEVDVPDDFSVCETVAGSQAFFRDGYNDAYSLISGNSKCEGTNPYLIGGSPVESIKLTVIGKYLEKEE